jgi:hypothetical protein
VIKDLEMLEAEELLRISHQDFIFVLSNSIALECVTIESDFNGMERSLLLEMEEINKRVEGLVMEIRMYIREKKELEVELNKCRATINDQKNMVAEKEEKTTSLAKEIRRLRNTLKAKERGYKNKERDLKNTIRRKERESEKVLSGCKTKPEYILMNEVRDLEKRNNVLCEIINHIGENMGCGLAVLSKIQGVVDGVDDPLIQKLMKDIEERGNTESGHTDKFGCKGEGSKTTTFG